MIDVPYYNALIFFCCFHIIVTVISDRKYVWRQLIEFFISIILDERICVDG